MRRAAIAWTRSLLALAVLALVLSACAQATASNPVPGFFPLPAITDQGQASQSLYVFILGIATAIFLLVEGLILWSVLRYRRRKGDDELPVQTHGNNLLEVTWTVLPDDPRARPLRVLVADAEQGRRAVEPRRSRSM